MFGQHIDYWLLRPFVHERNRATEEELNEEFRTESFNLDAAMLRVKKLVTRFDGRFPLNPNLRYLDVGCGRGDITIALAKAGCGAVDGVDNIPRCIESARNGAAQAGVEGRVDFYCVDVHEFAPDQPYDVVLSNEALEHIQQPDVFLKSLARLVKPGGLAYLAFGPLFHSPMGDHAHEFFRVPIPWRGVLFSEKALLRLRREFYRPGEPVERYQDASSGLNRMRYSQFLDHVRLAEWDFEYLTVNPQLKRIPPLFPLSNFLMRIAGVKDYVAMSVCAALRRRCDAPSKGQANGPDAERRSSVPGFEDPQTMPVHSSPLDASTH